MLWHPVQHCPRSNSKQKVANLNLASVLVRPLGINDFPSEDWKQAILQPLLLSQVELAISANYLCGYFCLHSKQKSGDPQRSAAGGEQESPLYTCPDPDALQPRTNHTDSFFNAAQQKTAPTCTWFGSDSSFIWSLQRTKNLDCWSRKSSDTIWFSGQNLVELIHPLWWPWEHELLSIAACLLNSSWHPFAGWYLSRMPADIGTHKEFFLPAPAHCSPLTQGAAVISETWDIQRVIEQTRFWPRIKSLAFSPFTAQSPDASGITQAENLTFSLVFL